MRRRYEALVGALLLVSFGILAFMSLKIGTFSSWNATEFSARFDDASGLNPGADVTVAGVAVGRVESILVDNGQALLILSIDPDVALYADAEVAIRSRSVLGEKYIALMIGDATQPVKAAGTALSSQPAPMDIDGVVQAIAPIIRAVDPEQVASFVEALGAIAADDPEKLRRIVDNVERLSDDLSAQGEQVGVAVSEARATMRAVRSGVGEASSAVKKAEQLIEKVEGPLVATLGDTDEAVKKLTVLLAELDGAGVDLKTILSSMSEMDSNTVRRFMREEGVLIRFRPLEVVKDPNQIE